MFPKNDQEFPEIRFPEFTYAWEQRKLGDVINLIVREIPKPTKPYTRISVRSHAKGTFHQFVDEPDKVAMENVYVVKEGDLIVNITFAWEHAIAVATKEDDGLVVSHRFPTYRTNDKSDIQFLKYLVSKKEFKTQLELISPGGAGRNRVMSKKDFLEINISISSSLEEQQKIGTFFTALDRYITIHQRKLENMQKLKKSLLQQMFV
ncbi:restriction endonuclease subunit S [Actinobacillus sp. GY-402]|nr:restriction endonuclease subunit S [Actinobacillus sp. GY-402]